MVEGEARREKRTDRACASFAFQSQLLRCPEARKPIELVLLGHVEEGLFLQVGRVSAVGDPEFRQPFHSCTTAKQHARAHVVGISIPLGHACAATERFTSLDQRHTVARPARLRSGREASHAPPTIAMCLRSACAMIRLPPSANGRVTERERDESALAPVTARRISRGWRPSGGILRCTRRPRGFAPRPIPPSTGARSASTGCSFRSQAWT